MHTAEPVLGRPTEGPAPVLRQWACGLKHSTLSVPPFSIMRPETAVTEV